MTALAPLPRARWQRARLLRPLPGEPTDPFWLEIGRPQKVEGIALDGPKAGEFVSTIGYATEFRHRHAPIAIWREEIELLGAGPEDFLVDTPPPRPWPGPVDRFASRFMGDRTHSGRLALAREGNDRLARLERRLAQMDTRLEALALVAPPPSTSSAASWDAPPTDAMIDALREQVGVISLWEAEYRLRITLCTEALRVARGNKKQAARLLGLNRTTFLEMMKRLKREGPRRGWRRDA